MTQQTYLSPNRYLRGGYGNGEDLTKAALRNILTRASATVNAYCAGPSQPQAFDFRGGTVTGEQHDWPYVAPLLIREGSRRVYVNQRPLQTVTSLVIRLAKTYSISLDPATNIMVNKMEGYAEIVSINPTIVGYFPAGLNFGLWTPIAEIDYTYGWTFSVAGDVLEAETTTLYTASHGNWTATAPVIYVDGVIVSSSNYSYSADDGSVTFTTAAAPVPGTEVTADYSYNCPDAVSQATGLIASDLIGKARIASRGMIGIQSLRVAEVAITQMSPSQMTTKGGVTIPSAAAQLLNPFVIRSAA